MHPTGMLSCFDVSFLKICKLNPVSSVGLSTSHGLFTLHREQYRVEDWHNRKQKVLVPVCSSFPGPRQCISSVVQCVNGFDLLPGCLK